MGMVLLPGVRVRLLRAVVPIKVVVLAMELLKVTFPIERVMTVGFGIDTVPIILVPSASGVSLIEKEVTLKPAKPFKPKENINRVSSVINRGADLSWQQSCRN